MPTEADHRGWIDEDALAEWTVAQRWFASKAREVTIGVADVLPLSEDPPLALALVEARFAAGTHDLYQLVVGRSQLDVLGSAEHAAALVRLLTGQAVVEDVHGRVAFHWIGPTSPDPKVRILGAEQSNTSIVIDESVVLKVFRRMAPGDNPELEMLRFLSGHDFPHVPALAGWYELTGDPLDATLGVAQEFIADGRDGWDMVLDTLAEGDPRSLLDELHALGAIIGRMHSVLGSDATDPDFAPEEPGDEAIPLLTATIDEEIEQVFLDLPEDNEAVAPILGRGQELRERLQLMSRVVVGGRAVRHHGDLHLGQTLKTTDSWVILDFEGEPARSLIERRRKRSPLRDVAGMLRSLAYAASAAGILRGHAAPPGWEHDARTRFLEGYFEEVDPALMPAGEAGVDHLLRIFELEKAVYELRYELNNRPDWVSIPVAGIARLLEDAPT